MRAAACSSFCFTSFATVLQDAFACRMYAIYKPGGKSQLVGSAVRMIRAIVKSLPVKRGIFSSFKNGAGDFLASNDFFFQPGSGWGLFSC